MRPIKYKVWDKDKKVMHQPDEICRIHFGKELPDSVLLWNGERLHFGNFELLRYIGENDTKKKGIYIGDKVEWFGYEAGYEAGKGTIQLRPKKVSVVTDKIADLYRIFNLVNNGLTTTEVIGNIYEDSG